MRDEAGRYIQNQELCRSDLHLWAENAVESGGVLRCRECVRMNSRRYKMKNRKSAPSPPTSIEWRDIPGYEGLYQISERGDIWRITKSQGTSGGLVRVHKRGRYWKATLCKDGIEKEFRIHVLVALAFINLKPETAEVVRHLDDDADNNHFSNIAYGTRSDNVRDMHANIFGRRWLTEEDREAIRIDYRPTDEIADEYGIARQTVRRIKHQGKEDNHGSI